jgi:acyl carrier protein
MAEEYDQILEVVAENPGTTIEEITDLARDYGITSADVSELVSMAVSNDDIIEFSGRHWVMRTGKYRFDRYDHSKT